MQNRSQWPFIYEIWFSNLKHKSWWWFHAHKSLFRVSFVQTETQKIPSPGFRLFSYTPNLLYPLISMFLFPAAGDTVCSPCGFVPHHLLRFGHLGVCTRCFCFENWPDFLCPFCFWLPASSIWSVWLDAVYSLWSSVESRFWNAPWHFWWESKHCLQHAWTALVGLSH